MKRGQLSLQLKSKYRKTAEQRDDASVRPSQASLQEKLLVDGPVIISRAYEAARGGDPVGDLIIDSITDIMSSEDEDG